SSEPNSICDAEGESRICSLLATTATEVVGLAVVCLADAIVLGVLAGDWTLAVVIQSAWRARSSDRGSDFADYGRHLGVAIVLGSRPAKRDDRSARNSAGGFAKADGPGRAG